MILALDFDATVAMPVGPGRRVDTGEGPVFVAAHVEAMLRALDAREDVLCVWYSGREEAAAGAMRAALRLDWPFIPLGHLPGTDVEVKLDGLTSWGWWDPGAPCLIVDDAAPPAHWLPANVSCLQVDPSTGITPEQAAWIADWTARATMDASA